jgi:putative transposase
METWLHFREDRLNSLERSSYMDISEQIAAFRYGLIATIVSRQTPFLPGEIKAILMEVVAQHYSIPGSTRTKVSMRSLERYISDYRKHGWDGLKPKKRAPRPLVIAPRVLEMAAELRRERPERSVEQLIYLLENTKAVEPGALAQSTLARHLRNKGLSRKELLPKAAGRRRFEASGPHILWQADFQHTLYLPDPVRPDRKRKALLFAIIDDYSRFIVHGEFYWDEKLPRLEDALKKALLKHGIPEQLYCDNAAVFASQHLERICGKLGIRLSHSRPYQPQGRGKIERWFRFVDTSFKPEAYLQIENGQIITLSQLNDAFAAWCEGYYHAREHGSTHMTPVDRAQTDRVRRRATFVELTEIFLREESRKVDNASCIRLFGNTYEVDSQLSRQSITVRYDPFDLKDIQVWHNGKRFGSARVLELTRSSLEKQHVSQDKPLTGVDFFALAQQKRNEALDPFTFAKEGGHA